MKRRLAAVAISAVLLFNVTPALAAEMPAPGGSSAFGTHVSSMSPDCATTMGADYGQHLSTMAKGGDCGCAK